MRTPDTTDPESRSRRIGIAIALALHAAALVALLSYAPVRNAVVAAAPVIMTFQVAPPAERPTEPPKPLPLRPVARPVRSPVVAPAPILAIEAPAPATAEAVPREEPKALAPVASAPSAAPPAAPALATTPPSFDAAYLDNPPPQYPALARRIGEQGRVVLRVLVTVNGTAQTVELRTSSGSARLDNAALETVKRWRFVPARHGDAAVAAHVLVPINFTLEN